ncbi:conserved hypothetical protein [Neospora caninum Liverpool]|uniref:Thioredoxin domain-containing protein n=1 Tax=Neospora caninum (strain Liverpool) TaxID=572307 RepID=F0VJH1_NEOCL|nr:conserved hypothetical protein [Neospora caninum Liverpool]CBZ53882.1 conserved hypothetical protein [Neospora caninum Liverpool]|eukprot:XP_003883914.1 conserved hypothetical protein [Neospora caninum Liverpool]
MMVFVHQHLTAGDVVIVLFFSRHCPHCIRFKAIYSRLADRLGQKAKTEQNGVYFAAMDAGAAQVGDQEDSIWAILREFQVAFIPDVRILVPLHRVKSVDADARSPGSPARGGKLQTGSVQDLGVDYQGLSVWTLQVPHEAMSEDGIHALLRVHVDSKGIDKLEERDGQHTEKRRSRQETLENNLKELASICPASPPSFFPPSTSSSSHPALCRGQERWEATAERVEAETPRQRLHDALAVLLHMLKNWVVAGDTSAHLSLEKERALVRLLEVARYALPGKTIKAAVFRLLLQLHEQGSGVQPLPPDFLSKDDIQGALMEVNQSENVETSSETDSASTDASPAPASTGPSVEAAEDDAEPSVVRLLPKDKWEKLLAGLKIAGVSGEDATPGSQLPALRHCRTLLCGVWTLFHILAEGAHAQFMRKVDLARARGWRPAGAEAPERKDRDVGDRATDDDEVYVLTREGEEQQTRENDRGDNRNGLWFFGPYDSVAVYAAQQYKKLLRAERAEQETGDLENEDASNLRKEAADGESKHESEAAYMLQALKDTFGPVQNEQALNALEEELVVLETQYVLPASVVMAAVRDWVFSFFTCIACRTHFLQCFEQGFYGRDQVSPPTAHTREGSPALAEKRRILQRSLITFLEKLKRMELASELADSASPASSNGESPTDEEREALLSSLPAWMWLSADSFRVRDSLEVVEEEGNLKNLLLWLWRLHNAVTVRTAAEATVEALASEDALEGGMKALHVGRATSFFTASGEPLGIGELAKRGLKTAYFLHADPRWPPAGEAACRREGTPPFLLTPDYIASKGASEQAHLCENVDFTEDFDLVKVRKWLRRTYWRESWEHSGEGDAVDVRDLSVFGDETARLHATSLLRGAEESRA